MVAPPSPARTPRTTGRVSRGPGAAKTKPAAKAGRAGGKGRNGAGTGKVPASRKAAGAKGSRAEPRGPSGRGDTGSSRQAPKGGGRRAERESERTSDHEDGYHSRPRGRGGLRRFTLVVRPPLAGAGIQPTAPPGFARHGRRPNLPPESVYEKQMVLVAPDNDRPADLLWADARFAVDAVAEHALFFSMMMPPELAAADKRKAQAFHERYTRLWQYLDSKGPPAASEVKSYVQSIEEETQPFVDFTEECHRAQLDGTLRSLAWPLFYDHCRRETDRALSRLDSLAAGQVHAETRELVEHGCTMMEENCRFIAHLLDPSESEHVGQAFREASVFRSLRERVGATRQDAEPSGGDLDAIEAAAERLLDFKTEMARRVESARVRSALSPILADHMRREALKFVDDLRRARATTSAQSYA